MRKTLTVAAVAVLGLAIAAGAWYLRNEKPLAVTVAERAEAVPVRVFGLGTVEARVLSKIGFQVPGTVVALRADVGDRVAAGTVLGEIDAREQRARLLMADSAVDRAEADLRTAEARLARAQAVHAQAAQTHQRRQALLRQAAVSEEKAEDAAAALAVAAADVRVGAGEVAVREAALRDARAQRDLQAVILDQHRLAAPYDAQIVERHREAGAVVNPGEPVFTLVDPDSIWIRAFVDEAAAGGLAPGQPAVVRLRSLPGREFAGHVARIDLESDRVSEERRVHVRCDDCPPQLYLGEQAEVVIETGRIADAVLVPQTAVAEYGGDTGVVWTLEDGRLRRREVTFGRRTLDGRLEIAGGLPQGAQVLAAVPARAAVGRDAVVAGGGAP